MTHIQRPSHLPDYENPPLNEVVLGVQFAPAQGYQQILAGEVWNLYRANYPLVEEKPPIPPAFELFGASAYGGIPNFGIGVLTEAQHDRFWFLAKDKNEIIQFQQDRLLHNWRKLDKGANDYPRFDKMIENFTKELQLLEEYFSKLKPQHIICNQAEISYVNHIRMPKSGERSKISDWLRAISFNDEPDDIYASARKIITSPEGKPTSRLTYEATANSTVEGNKLLALTLTVRGAPADSTTASALDFLKIGREKIIMEFDSITTASAHKLWEKL